MKRNPNIIKHYLWLLYIKFILIIIEVLFAGYFYISFCPKNSLRKKVYRQLTNQITGAQWVTRDRSYKGPGPLALLWPACQSSRTWQPWGRRVATAASPRASEARGQLSQDSEGWEGS